MTVQNTNTSLMFWPGAAVGITNNYTLGARTLLDAAGEYHSNIMEALEDMTISHIYLKLHAVSGSPTADLRIETVDGTGLPSGTLWATNTNIVTGTLTTTGTVHALTASASITRGQWFCVKILYNSGTSITTQETQGFSHFGINGYSVINTGTPTKGGFVNTTIGLGSSATSWYNLQYTLLPVSGSSSVSINNTNGARTGVRFQLPFKAEIHGLVTGTSSWTTPHDVTFYDDAGTAITGATGTHNTTNLNLGNQYCSTLIGTPFVPNINTWYRAASVPTSATNWSLKYLTTNSTDMLTAFPGRGYMRRTDYTTAGGWSDANGAHFSPVDLIIRKLDDGAGSGGGASFFAHPL